MGTEGHGGLVGVQRPNLCVLKGQTSCCCTFYHCLRPWEQSAGPDLCPALSSFVSSLLHPFSERDFIK